MRSHFLLAFVSCAILLTDYSDAAENVVVTTLDAGDQMDLSIFNVHKIVKCYLEFPDGNIVEFIPNDQSTDKVQKNSREHRECGVRVNDMQASDSGSWTIRAESDADVRQQVYKVTVNPTEENDGEITNVEYMDVKNIFTTLGGEHEVVIREVDTAFQSTESCHIITPSGRQFSTNTFNMDGAELYSNDVISCGIKIKIQNGDFVGQWFLVSTIRKLGERIQRRLPFTIRVEEIVDTHLKEIFIVEGSDFYIRLKNSIEEYESCKLKGPDGNIHDTYERDSRYTDTCGFIVKNVSTKDQGKWEIVYGKTIIYRAPFVVTMSSGAVNADSPDIVFTLDRPASINVGPENVIYCVVRDPQEFLVFEGFGRCNITLDRARSDHQGIWKMSYGFSGQVVTTDVNFNVRIVEADTKPVVEARVVADKPIVTLSCFVSSPDPVRTCKFRDPSGRILIATEGVGSSRYTFHGSAVSYTSGLHTHDCGIQITDPVVQDLGLWRCGIETEGDTYYGFLSVLCPWAMRDPEVAAQVITEPTLTATRDAVTAVVGDTVSMSCSVPSAIRYCYFRARNGTVFNLEPGTSHDTATYWGAGLDAGECGVRFSGLAVRDTGAWSCHVGLKGEDHTEQRANIDVTVHDSMVAQQRMVGSQLQVEAQVFDHRALDYCRFVRIDGVGFTGENQNLPEGYHSVQSLASGRCGLVINSPTMLDHHPWTVVARVTGHEELSRVTAHTIDMPVGDVDPDSENQLIIYYRVPYVWILLMSVGLMLILIAVLTGPKKNREWTYNRASAIRDSVRRSFTRKTIEQGGKDTAMAA